MFGATFYLDRNHQSLQYSVDGRYITLVAILVLGMFLCYLSSLGFNIILILPWNLSNFRFLVHNRLLCRRAERIGHPL